jgi:hypothetical protein
MKTVEWVAHEHFKNPISTLIERGQFVGQLRGYSQFLENLYPNMSGIALLPVEATNVDNADFPLLKQLVESLRQEFTRDHTLSLGVNAEVGKTSSHLGLFVQRDGEIFSGVEIQEDNGHVDLVVMDGQGSEKSQAVVRAKKRMETEIYSGGAQHMLAASDKLFKFIVDQTL